MAEFSVTEAAFSGFRFVKNRPLTIVTWAVAYVVLIVGLFGILFGLAGAALLPMITNPQAFENNPGQVMQALPGMFAAIVVFMVVGVLAAGLIYGAVYRAFLRPQEGGLGYFRFGGDELRLIGAYLLLVLIYIGVVLLSSVAVAAVTFGGGDAGGLMGGLLNLVVSCVIIWGAVRLSLVLPATFARRRITIGEAWRMTKGRFWKLTGAYLLAGALLIAAYIIIVILVGALGGAAFGGIMAGANPAQILATSAPLIIVMALLYPLIGACTLPVMIGPTASAYAQLSTDPDKTAEAFA